MRTVVRSRTSMLMRMSTRTSTPFAVAFAVLAGAVMATGVAASVAGAREGAGLFDGRHPLAGRLAHHAQALPAEALRCVNCHARGPAASAAVGISAATGVSAATPGFAPTLSAAHLTGHIERRGGPPSRYDRSAFCQVLRTGVDPAGVLLPRAMPRYDVTDAQCAALWAHLTQGAT